VYSTVRTVLDDLPRIYTPELYQEKCDRVYGHVFDCYQGEGKSVYQSA
jgi:type I restriction enzyme R subunit